MKGGWVGGRWGGGENEGGESEAGKNEGKENEGGENEGGQHEGGEDGRNGERGQLTLLRVPCTGPACAFPAARASPR